MANRAELSRARQLISRVEAKVLESMVDGDWKGLYYRLSAFKLLKELGLLSVNGQGVYLNSLATWLDINNTNALLKKARALHKGSLAP